MGSTGCRACGGVRCGVCCVWRISWVFAMQFWIYALLRWSAIVRWAYTHRHHSQSCFSFSIRLPTTPSHPSTHRFTSRKSTYQPRTHTSTSPPTRIPSYYSSRKPYPSPAHPSHKNTLKKCTVHTPLIFLLLFTRSSFTINKPRCFAPQLAPCPEFSIVFSFLFLFLPFSLLHILDSCHIKTQLFLFPIPFCSNFFPFSLFRHLVLVSSLCASCSWSSLILNSHCSCHQTYSVSCFPFLSHACCVPLLYS